ncbi:response regulator receiver modulated diguanylate cyclase [Halopseudomonas litoralis]|uniref:diguanylate cyclase n=1 Tax=Halopseudomonas litoralis TaxID=797277 RepID=A0A1H1TEK3_9GAMM|nr:diguanylate cyclase [Halopseudomonas litoralis]SDS58653.1 response regulator receiver modulated diguanylate cyclase [Halopseudomonas litoralis]
MDKAEQLHQRLAILAKGFRARLDNELPALDKQMRELPESWPAAADSLQRTRDQLHKLAGAAGTFGYPALGSKAHELEYQVRDLIEQQQCDNAARQALIEGVIELAQLRHSATTESPTAPAEPASEYVDRPRVIYVFEQDDQFAKRLRHTLESFGYQVILHSTLDELQQVLTTDKADALIFDLSGGAQSTELLENLQRLQDQRHKPLPLILISDREDFTFQLSAVRAGAQGLFPTPVDLTALENQLERCFNNLHSEPFRILLVDDDETLAQRYQAVLNSAAMRVEIVSDPRILLERMDAFLPDVILMDINMPNYSGPELAQMIRLNDSWLRVPVVYLSAETDATRQKDALFKAGDDFITKPISDNALINAVYSRAQRARLLSQALARDSLTGLLKHADIKEQIEIELERACRTRRPVSIAMIDIDHFKSVNDQYGHAVGDNVIRALANLLRQRLRKIDRLGRYGGEEFVAVLPDCHAEDAKRILDEIRVAFNELQFSASNGLFHCSFSAGVSACQAPLWETSGQLASADARLYLAKSQGRNCIVSTADTTQV